MATRPNSTPPAQPIDSPDRRRLPPLLRRAWYGLNQAFRRRIAGTGATPDQFTALRCLTEADAKGITQSQLTKPMASDPNTIASLVERMEAAGWIERLPHEKDRRAYRIRVKPEGKRLYKQLRELAIGLQASVLTVVPEGEREGFLTQLAAVADACREAAEKSPKRGK